MIYIYIARDSSNYFIKHLLNGPIKIKIGENGKKFTGVHSITRFKTMIYKPLVNYVIYHLTLYPLILVSRPCSGCAVQKLDSSHADERIAKEGILLLDLDRQRKKKAKKGACASALCSGAPEHKSQF